MMKRSATANWHGKHSQGSGSLSTQSSVLADAPYSFEARFQEGESSHTNPEELLAAAHAGCYAMSLGYALEQAGMKVERIDVQATVSLSEMEGGFEISGIHLDVSASVPGLSAADFAQVAEAAKALCPLSLALYSTPTTLLATLGD